MATLQICIQLSQAAPKAFVISQESNEAPDPAGGPQYLNGD